MSLPREIETSRLTLRRWTLADLEPFARINADADVMEFFPSTLTREESDALLGRINNHFDSHGFGLWAVEVKSGPLIGFIGLNVPRFDAHFTPCVEIAWRLAKQHWGNGYAPEGARAALDFAFGPLDLDEVVALTTTNNYRSRRVMEKIDMTCSEDDDFDHPWVEDGPLRRHVLYRITPDSRRTE